MIGRVFPLKTEVTNEAEDAENDDQENIGRRFPLKFRSEYYSLVDKRNKKILHNSLPIEHMLA
jgi:hypothetical protein